MTKIEEKLKEKLKNYIDKYLKEENLICNEHNVIESRICADFTYVPRACSAKSKPLDDFITGTRDQNDFQTVLFRMIEERT